MGAQGVLGIEWRDEQSGSRYPFTDSSSLTSPEVSIDKDIFLDAIVYIMGAEGPIYLRSVTVESGLITITIEDEDSSHSATAEFDPFDSNGNIGIFDQYDRPAGLLVCDSEKLDRFKSWPLGTYSFGSTAEFVASVVVPLPDSKLSGFMLPDGTLMTGEVIFVAEDGVVLTKEDGYLRVDVVGDPLFKRKQCKNDVVTTDLFVTPNFVRTINGMPPDSYGNFVISGNNELAADTILRVYPDSQDNALRVEFVGQKLESIV